MTIPLVIGPQDASDLLARINTLTIQVNALLTGSIALALGPQDVSDMVGRLNNLTVQVNILVPATIPLLQGPQDASDLLARLNLLTNQVNALGGSPTPYHADAVHFDGTQTLEQASTTVADSTLAFCCFWALGDWDGSLNNDYLIFFSSFGFALYPGTMLSGVGDGDASLSFSYNNPTNAVWHSVIAAVNTGIGGNANLQALYIDDVQVVPTDTTNANAFTMGLHGKSVAFCASNQFSPSTVGDFSDVQMWVGQTIVQSDNTILEADRRNFISASGRPVDPAIAAAAYGSPDYLFSGNASGFATNLGTGGAFTLTGTLTNSSTSPSD